MIYSASITTPANTAKGAAKKTVLKVTKGLLWVVEIEFPAGCAGLTHIQIFDGLYQVFPASPGDSLHSDGAVLSYDDIYFKTAAPFTFSIKTWNLDDTWDHTLQVRIGFASSDAAMSRYLPAMAWENFAKYLAEAQADQEKLRLEQISVITKQLGVS